MSGFKSPCFSGFMKNSRNGTWNPFTFTRSEAVSPSVGHSLPNAFQFSTATGSLVAHVEIASPITSSKICRESGTKSSGTISDFSVQEYYFRIRILMIKYMNIPGIPRRQLTGGAPGTGWVIDWMT